MGSRQQNGVPMYARRPELEELVRRQFACLLAERGFADAPIERQPIDVLFPPPDIAFPRPSPR